MANKPKTRAPLSEPDANAVLAVLDAWASLLGAAAVLQSRFSYHTAVYARLQDDHATESDEREQARIAGRAAFHQGRAGVLRDQLHQLLADVFPHTGRRTPPFEIAKKWAAASGVSTAELDAAVFGAIDCGAYWWEKRSSRYRLSLFATHLTHVAQAYAGGRGPRPAAPSEPELARRIVASARSRMVRAASAKDVSDDAGFHGPRRVALLITSDVLEISEATLGRSLTRARERGLLSIRDL